MKFLFSLRGGHGKEQLFHETMERDGGWGGGDGGGGGG